MKKFYKIGFKDLVFSGIAKFDNNLFFHLFSNIDNFLVQQKKIFFWKNNFF